MPRGFGTSSSLATFRRPATSTRRARCLRPLVVRSPILRPDLGLAASPPARYTLEAEGGPDASPRRRPAPPHGAAALDGAWPHQYVRPHDKKELSGVVVPPRHR